jgi:hypothetical protein
MKECFAITTYCNTEEKIQALNKTINNIKQYGLPIFIHAHYPLNDQIQKKIHSYFYSSDNPILPRWNAFWYDIDKYRLEIKVYDYYYTTLKGWSESIKILDEFDRIHMINYDTNLYPELFMLSRKYEKSLFLENPHPTKKYIRPTYFCLNKASFNFFRENITLQKYLECDLRNGQFLPLIEEFIPSFITSDEFFQIPQSEYDSKRLLEYDIMADTRFEWNKTLYLNGTKFFIGEDEGIAKILFFDVEDKREVFISVYYNDNVFDNSFFNSDASSTHLITLDDPFNNIKNLAISINGVFVSNDIIQKLIHLESKIYHL